MNTSIKNFLTVFAIATTLTLTSCHSEQVDPKPAAVKKTTVAPSLHTEDDDQPPKVGDKGGN